MKTRIKLIGFILLLGLNFQGMGQHRSHGEPLRKGRISLKLTVRDSHNRNAVEYATLLLKKGKNRQFSGITDEKGSHTFLSIPKGDYELTVTSLGYKSRTIDLHARRDTTLTILLLSNDIAMQDVVVTAYESRGATSASRIDRKAMEHLQPSSFTDLVELLPGNVSKDPSMGSANLIKLREAGGTGPSDYDVTSFGTSFVIDGVPLNNDANMQYTSN
ncbi:MAG: carboxypeptidase-like regulatory domain-containing protein, partial [Barnesiella intestinihominis]